MEKSFQIINFNCQILFTFEKFSRVTETICEKFSWAQLRKVQSGKFSEVDFVNSSKLFREWINNFLQ